MALSEVRPWRSGGLLLGRLQSRTRCISKSHKAALWSSVVATESGSSGSSAFPSDDTAQVAERDGRVTNDSRDWANMAAGRVLGVSAMHAAGSMYSTVCIRQ